MKLWELISDPKLLADAKGFTVGKTRKKPIIWKKVHMDDSKDRKSIRVERRGQYGDTIKQYVDPSIEVTIVPKK